MMFVGSYADIRRCTFRRCRVTAPGQSNPILGGGVFIYFSRSRPIPGSRKQ